MVCGPLNLVWIYIGQTYINTKYELVNGEQGLCEHLAQKFEKAFKNSIIFLKKDYI